MRLAFLAALMVPAFGLWAVLPVQTYGRIDAVNIAAQTLTIHLTTTKSFICRLTMSTDIKINGAKATIRDLSPGMQVTLTLSDSVTVATVEANAPQRNANMGHPAIHPPGPRENAMDFAKRLGGTSWRIDNGPDGDDGNRWFILKADGTTSCGWNTIAGKWMVSGVLEIQTQFSGEEDSIPTFISFDPGLTRAKINSSSQLLPSNHSIAIRLDQPTPAMLEKVPQLAAPSGPVVAAGTQNTASGVIKANHNNLVFVTGKEGAGSGFIVHMGDANFLVTNAHVAAGINEADFKTLDNVKVQGGAASVAVGHDIFRTELPPGSGKPFEYMQGVDENASIGDEVVVLGNAEGSGVINTIIGKIVGIGPNLVEIDAQFVPGNSGSPIVHLKTGKVIGVATYLVIKKYDVTTKEKSKEPVIRRFGYRLDSVKTWQPVNLRSFYLQADAMKRIHTLTEDLDDFFRDLVENKYQVTLSRHTNPVIKNRMDQWLASKSHNHSAFDRADADANFISFLKVACQSDLSGIQRYLTYDYFLRELSEEQDTRNEMAKAFSQIIDQIRE